MCTLHSKTLDFSTLKENKQMRKLPACNPLGMPFSTHETTFMLKIPMLEIDLIIAQKTVIIRNV